MSKLAITGLSGEVGSFLLGELKHLPNECADLYSSSQFQHPSIQQHVRLDLCDLINVQKTLELVRPEIILHLAGIAHIDECEKDKINGKNGEVWKVNVLATSEIVKYCKKFHAKLIFLSTECVFDGEKECYKEEDKAKPINWYGETKTAAEKEIRRSGIAYAILRATIAYHPHAKKTIWQKIEKSIKNNGQARMANDHWMTPTYLSDISTAVDSVLEKDLSGIFHLGPKVSITPYFFAQKIAKSLGYSTEVIIPETLDKIIGKDKASLRLKHACLNSVDSSAILNVAFHSVEDVVKNL